MKEQSKDEKTGKEIMPPSPEGEKNKGTTVEKESFLEDIDLEQVFLDLGQFLF